MYIKLHAFRGDGMKFKRQKLVKRPTWLSKYGKTQGLVYSGASFHEFSNQLLTASAKFEKLNDSPSVRSASSPDRYFPVLTRQPCNENN